jgi:hypothetical protein
MNHRAPSSLPRRTRACRALAALALAACGGGASGTGGTGGTGGGAPCAAPADCPQPENDCQLAACNGGACSLEPKPEGGLCAQGAGTCDGNGQCNLCEPGFKACNGSTLLVCGESGTFDDPITCGGDTPYCDPVDPKCVGCFDTSQCVTPGMNPCLAVACLENACVTTLVPDGAACVANGATGVCSDGMCLLCVPGEQTCSGDTLLTCGPDGVFDAAPCGGATPLCDPAALACVECLAASDCGAVGDPCGTPACLSGACSVSTQPNGTPCALGADAGTCSAGSCQVCTSGEKRCKAGGAATPQLCVGGQWVDQAACDANAVCNQGTCDALFASCAAVKQANPAAASGLYPIDPDGVSSQPKTSLFCDFASGAWTLVANVFDSGADDAPNATTFVVSGWQQQGNGQWATPATVVARDASGGGSAAVSLPFVAALDSLAGQQHLRICLVSMAGLDVVCRSSLDGSLTLAAGPSGNPKLAPYAQAPLTYAFGRLAGLGGTTDGYDYGSFADGGAPLTKTPGLAGEFGTSPVLAEYPGGSYFGVWHGGGLGVSYRPSLTNDNELGAVDSNPSPNSYGFRLYVGP